MKYYTIIKVDEDGKEVFMADKRVFDVHEKPLADALCHECNEAWVGHDEDIQPHYYVQEFETFTITEN